MKRQIAIVDYGLGNIRSVMNALECFDVDVQVAETGKDLVKAHGIVLPGVGSFDAGMRGLRERGHEEALNGLVREEKVPFLGICLGFQFMFEGSEEGTERGLGWLPGRLKCFPVGKGYLKVPHIGWSDVVLRKSEGVFRDLLSPHTLYFVHSYYLPLSVGNDPEIAAVGQYGCPFVAAVEYENIVATQFHPEKSQLAGMKMIENFLSSI